jgi:hypothetical protein
MRATFPAHSILLDLIILIILVQSKSYEAPHYAIMMMIIIIPVMTWNKPGGCARDSVTCKYTLCPNKERYKGYCTISLKGLERAAFSLGNILVYGTLVRPAIITGNFWPAGWHIAYWILEVATITFRLDAHTLHTCFQLTIILYLEFEKRNQLTNRFRTR